MKGGDSVAAGAALVELDPLYAAEDAKSSGSQLDRLKLRLARVDAELAGTSFAPREILEALRVAALNEYTLRKQALATSLVEAQAATDKPRELIDARQGLAAGQAAVQPSKAAVAQAQAAIARVQADYRRQLLSPSERGLQPHRCVVSCAWTDENCSNSNELAQSLENGQQLPEI